MKKIPLACLLAFLAIMTTGCAAPIKYGFDKSLYRRAEPSALKAVVDLFQDLRTQDEHDGTFSVTKRFLYTNDKSFKKDIEAQISQMLVKHLEKAALFDAVEFKDIDDDVFKSPEKMSLLQTEGYDVAVQGDLYHLYGYRSGANAAAFFGLAGILTEALVNKKVVGGRAAYGEVKFVDLKSGKTVWEGNFSHDFEDRDTFYDAPPHYAIQALKQVNDQLTQKLSEAIDGM